MTEDNLTLSVDVILNRLINAEIAAAALVLLPELQGEIFEKFPELKS